VADTISAVSSLLWPLLALVVLLSFHRPLRRLIDPVKRRRIMLEVGGQELSLSEVTKEQSKLVADLQEQVVVLRRELEALATYGATRLPGEPGGAPPVSPGAGGPTLVPHQSSGSSLEEHQSLAPGASQDGPNGPGGSPAEELVLRRGINWVARRRRWAFSRRTRATEFGAEPFGVLWVDDNPKSFALLADQLHEKGIQVDVATTTSQALDRLGERRYRAVVTDMSRAEGNGVIPDAGVRLIRQVRRADEATPVLVYTNEQAARHFGSEAVDAGADAVTTSAVGLTERFRELGLL
jgi:CheY-like chemotaxis protein